MKRAVSLATFLLLFSIHAPAAEKHWRAEISGLIVIGQFHPRFPIPGF